MFTATTLIELIEANRKVPRNVTYLEGDGEERSVSFAELYERALGILHHLQRLGARRGDKLILFLGSNEPFIDAFWAAVLGGIIPVPIAPGISDEHRHKLLRIARKLGSPYIYTDRKSLERIAAFAQSVVEAKRFASLRARAFVVDDLDDISRAGSAVRAQPDDVAFIQFSSGSTSEPKGVVLTHDNILANARGSTEMAHFTQDDVSVSWMPLTHDMGLIGFHVYMFANRVHSHLMPTELFVRRPLLWLMFAARKRSRSISRISSARGQAMRTICPSEAAFGPSRPAPSMPGIVIIRCSSEALVSTAACSVFRRSASGTRIESPRARSVVMWWPPTAMPST